jgi:hypothetical protein
MNRNTYTAIALVALTIAAIAMLIWISSTDNEVKHMKAEIALLQGAVDSLKAQVPGLGEYMSTVQLHTAKLWFAGKASNWKLAKFEVDELGETMAATEALHAKRNDVDISTFVMGTRKALLPLFEQSIVKKKLTDFDDAYRQLLIACNSCHRKAGYEFIQIITPSREPVTNQQWKAIAQ